MSVSKDINTEFQTYLDTKSLKVPCKYSCLALSFFLLTNCKTVAFNIFVLATGSWPLQAPNSNFNIPNEVIQSINYFKAFYESKYQGRKLTYLQHLSRAETDMRAVKGKVSMLK